MIDMKNDRSFCSTPIEDDFELLDLMVSDANKVDKIYKPGPFWMNKTKSAVRELKKFGLDNLPEDRYKREKNVPMKYCLIILEYLFV